MSSNTIKAIIWDLGNIFVTFDNMKVCINLADYSNKSPLEIYTLILIGETSPFILHDMGAISSGEFFSSVKKIINLNENLKYEEFCTLWSGIFSENKAIENLLNKINHKVPHCLLSNTDPIHWNYLKDFPLIKNNFPNPALHILSFTSKAMKPDNKIYKDALLALSLSLDDISSVLLIDDMAINREGFEKLGGKSLAYNCSIDEIDVLEKGLIDWGLI